MTRKKREFALVPERLAVLVSIAGAGLFSVALLLGYVTVTEMAPGSIRAWGW